MAATPQASGGPPDLTITDKVYLEIGLCKEGLRQDRTLGDKSAICTDSQSLGRVVIGLYGHLVPQTVANFKNAMASGAYTGTTISKVLPGAYIQAGQQGSKRLGQVDPAAVGELPPNSEVASPSSFRVRHQRPGAVSLTVVGNDDDPLVKQRKNYRQTEFVVTTGPGPVPDLDGQNIVFGQVLQGLDTTVSAITRVPTLKPYSQQQFYNKVASVLRDARAAKAKAKWDRPLNSVVITDSGILA